MWLTMCEHEPYRQATESAYVVRCRRCPAMAAEHVGTGRAPVLPPWVVAPDVVYSS